MKTAKASKEEKEGTKSKATSSKPVTRLTSKRKSEEERNDLQKKRLLASFNRQTKVIGRNDIIVNCKVPKIKLESDGGPVVKKEVMEVEENLLEMKEPKDLDTIPGYDIGLKEVTVTEEVDIPNDDDFDEQIIEIEVKAIGDPEDNDDSNAPCDPDSVMHKTAQLEAEIDKLKEIIRLQNIQIIALIEKLSDHQQTSLQQMELVPMSDGIIDRNNGDTRGVDDGGNGDKSSEDLVPNATIANKSLEDDVDLQMDIIEGKGLLGQNDTDKIQQLGLETELASSINSNSRTTFQVISGPSPTYSPYTPDFEATTALTVAPTTKSPKQVVCQTDKDIIEMNSLLKRKDIEMKELLGQKDTEMKSLLEKKDIEMEELLRQKDIVMEELLGQNDIEMKSLLEGKDIEMKDILEQKDAEMKDILEQRDAEMKDILEQKDIEMKYLLKQTNVQVRILTDKIIELEDKLSSANDTKATSVATLSGENSSNLRNYNSLKWLDFSKSSREGNSGITKSSSLQHETHETIATNWLTNGVEVMIKSNPNQTINGKPGVIINASLYKCVVRIIKSDRTFMVQTHQLVPVKPKPGDHVKIVGENRFTGEIGMLKVDDSGDGIVDINGDIKVIPIMFLVRLNVGIMAKLLGGQNISTLFWYDHSHYQKIISENVLKLMIQQGMDRSRINWTEKMPLLKKCRLISKPWRDSVDRLLESHSSHFDLCPHNIDLRMYKETFTPFPLRILSYNHSDKEILENYLRNYNPSHNPTRHVLIDVSRTQSEPFSAWKQFSNVLLNYLEVYGDNVWHFSVFIDNTHLFATARISAHQLLSKWLQLLPNLKTLTMNFDLCSVHANVNEDDESLILMPHLKDLVCIQYGTIKFQDPLLYCILKKNWHIEKLRFNGTINLGKIMEIKFSSLSEMTFDLHIDRDLLNLNMGALKIEKLNLQIFLDGYEVHNSLYSLTTFLSTFKNTLRCLKLQLPFSGPFQLGNGRGLECLHNETDPWKKLAELKKLEELTIEAESWMNDFDYDDYCKADDVSRESLFEYVCTTVQKSTCWIDLPDMKNVNFREDIRNDHDNA